MTSDEAMRLTATAAHAVTFSSRTAGEAKARNERFRAESARHVSGSSSAAPATPEHLRAAARRFRIGQGLPLPETEADLPVRRIRPSEPPTGDEEADFSQARIMVREDGTPPPPSFHRD